MRGLPFSAKRARFERQVLPPFTRSQRVGAAPPAEVHPLGHRVRVSVSEPSLKDTWLVHIAGTTADPTIFPPDRTLPQVAFDFRDLDLAGHEPDDPFETFRDSLGRGLRVAFQHRRPRHLVFVGHSFGGMVSLDFLTHYSLQELRAAIPSLQRVTAVPVCAAATSPMGRYRIRSDAPIIGPAATWLSHHVSKAATRSRDRMTRFKAMMPREPPRPLWRHVPNAPDELAGCWRLPYASSLDHFWSVSRCARAFDIPSKLKHGPGLWFDLLILSAEYDVQWPADMFESFWELVEATPTQRARWCHFPGDDHLSFIRSPVKYYKEIKDFLTAI